MLFLSETVSGLLLVIAGHVICQGDFHFTCPSRWKDGTPQQLECTIPLNKFRPPPTCDDYRDRVQFKMIKNGVEDIVCTVTDIDTACNNNINTDGCGCMEKSTTNVTVVYNVIAKRSLHENARWDCVPLCLDSNFDPKLSARNTTECFQTMFETIVSSTTPSETEPTPTPFRCAVGCIVPIVVGAVIIVVVVVVTILTCCRRERKLYVGDDREQIKRVDEHAQKLAGSKPALDKIAQEGSCGGISPADLSVGGCRALVDGRPRDDPEQLHVLVSLRLICCCRMEQIVTEVKRFLAKNVTPNYLRFVPVSEHTQVSRDSLQRIEKQTGTTIYPPAPNRSGGYVIQIERPTVENIERAKEKVEELIKTPNNDAANQQ